MSVTKISVEEIAKYIDSELNVLLSGPSGIGKTHKIIEACMSRNLVLKTFNASTMDPYADLIGVPAPSLETFTVDGEKRRYLEWIKTRDLRDANVILIDEINRGSLPTQNAVYEPIQFHSLNGEFLPNLKAVVSGINPPDEGYSTEEMDIALIDRFDIYADLEPYIDRRYFAKKFGRSVTSVAERYWRDHHDSYLKNKASSNPANSVGYLSPRKMDKILSNFTKFRDSNVLAASVPGHVNFGYKAFYKDLMVALNDDLKNGTASVTSEEDLLTSFEKIRGMDEVEIRRDTSSEVLEKYFSDITDSAERREAAEIVASAFNRNISPDRIRNNFAWFLRLPEYASVSTRMTAGWNTQKKSRLLRW